jgi:hypothetical protein
METIYSSETSVIFRTTRRYKPEEHVLHNTAVRTEKSTMKNIVLLGIFNEINHLI